MNVYFDKETLLNAISPAMSAVSQRNTVKAIEGIQIIARADGKVEMNTFDLEKGIRCYIPAEVAEEGSFIINAAKLNQIIRILPGRIHLEVDESCRVKISSGSAEYTLSALPGADFPNTPMLEGDWGFDIPQKELKDMLFKTMYAVASNDPRPALNGILFKITDSSITLVSSDSFRLSVAEKKLDLYKTSMDNKVLDINMVVPGKTVTELYKLLEDSKEPVRILATRKHIIAVMKNLTFFSRLINSDYIEYEKFIPKAPKTFVNIERNVLLECLERTALVSEDKTSTSKIKGHIVCKFGDGMLKLHSASVGGTVSDEAQVEITGPDIAIGMHCRYLLDAVRAADTEWLRISLTSPLVSVTIEPIFEREEAEKEKENERVEEKYLFLVVPVRM